MSFLYPLGFLALIAIPILILIYIIKNRYTEQTVASTYLWTLSERFLKRRVPINRITGIINLILQILAVVAIALILAHPVISLPGAARAYCFVLDGSGSMNIQQDDKTRFDIGKNKIEQIIKDSRNGSTYTLIYAGESTDVIYTDLTDKKAALNILDKLTVSYSSNNLNDARVAAQKYFFENPWAQTYLITDRAYEETENLTVINVAASVQNYSVSDIEYAQQDGALLVKGNVISYDSDATLKLDLYFSDSDKVFSTQNVEVVKGEVKPFEFRCVYVEDGEEKAKIDFDWLKVVIDNEDALALDNEVTVFNVVHENISRTLIVSGDSGANPSFFLTAALTAAGNTQFDVISASEYDGQTGYGLYIFDGYTPDEMPKKGVVWFINPQKSLQGSNFSFQSGNETARYPAKFSTSTSTVIRKQLQGTLGLDFEINYYVKVKLNGKFNTLITCDDSPILFTGTNTYGNREVVFAFDFHSSAPFVMLPDVNILIKNMLSYSFPEVVESTSYYCGDVAQVNMIAGCESIRIEPPIGDPFYPDTTTSISEFTVSEVGIYKIYLIMSDRSERLISVSSAMPLDERVPTVEDISFVINGEPEEGSLTGYLDDLLVIFIILAVIAVADYGVYSYEQWQLR